LGQVITLSGMDKMWASFVAMGLMVAASFLITYARTRTKGFVRILLSVIAFILFLPIMLYMLISMM
jgi:hypothetical protein